MKIFSTSSNCNFTSMQTFGSSRRGDDILPGVIKRDQVNYTPSDEFLRQQAEYQKNLIKHPPGKTIYKAHEVVITDPNKTAPPAAVNEESDDDRAKRVLGELQDFGAQSAAQQIVNNNTESKEETADEALARVLAGVYGASTQGVADSLASDKKKD